MHPSTSTPPSPLATSVPESRAETDAQASQIVEGTPDRPAFKPRQALFVFALVVYAIWVGMMIVWSVQLHSRK